MKLSILTPTYNANRCGYLERCIESVLEQDDERIEQVFSDAGSTDGTVDIINRYKQRYGDDRIKLVQAADKGVGGGLKNALSKSTGSVLGWLDADDFYYPKTLSDVVNLFETEKKTHFIYGDCDIVDGDGSKIGEFLVRDFDREIFLNVQHYIIFAACFFRRGVVEQCGFVNELGNDLYFYLNVAKRFDLTRYPVKVSAWRLHGQSISFEPSPREEAIRIERARQDFWLVIKHRGSIFSPRALTYFAVVERQWLAKIIKMTPVWMLPFLKRVRFVLHTAIARPESESGKYFVIPLIKRAVRILLFNKSS